MSTKTKTSDDAALAKEGALLHRIEDKCKQILKKLETVEDEPRR